MADAPTIEAGLFFLVLGIGLLGFVLIKKVVDFLIISMVLFMVLALMLYSGYDIVITKQVAAATEIQTEYNSTGQLVSNTTIFHPESNESTSIITGMHMALGGTFFAMAMVSFFLWLKLGLLNR